MSQFPQSLLEDPNIAEIAASMNMTPEQYLQSILDRPQPPILESLEAGPRMDTAPTVATQPAPVLESAPALSSGNGSVNFSDLQRANLALSATEGDRSGAYQPYDYNQGAIAEPLPVQQATVIDGTTPMLQPNPNEQAGANFDPVQAPVDFAAMEAQNSTSPVLINTTAPAPTTATANTAAQTPALSTTSSTTATRTPALSRGAGNMTANARGSALGMIPRGESLIRIGGAMYSGALKGDGLGAATREYGSIQDANRAAEVAAAKQAEATRLAELRANRLGAGKAGSKSTEGAGDLRFGISKLQTALGMIRGSDGSLTGLNPSALFDRFIGKTIGNEQEAQRLFLNEIGLDSIMKRVAETKGAISNAEMALFGRQVPQLGSQEIVWERWLQRQLQMAELLLARAEGGITVDPNAPLSQTMPGLSGGGGAGSSNMSAADAIVGI